MKITVLGAGGGEVTGSAYLVEAASARVLIDFGMFQGASRVEKLNRATRRNLAQGLDAVVVTHAHLDHVGRLPLLPKNGYTGPVFATPATIEIAELILRDSAHLQEADAERENRRRERQGRPPEPPLYGIEEVERLLPLMKPLRYESPTQVAPGIFVRAVEAGHMFGSASLELSIEEAGKTKVVVFSGDIGPRGAPLHRDPVPFRQANLVFLESTYGDRNHRPLTDTLVEARDVIQKAIATKGKILVPVFAVGRTQILLYLLAGAFKRKQLPKIPIYVDSPMAIEASAIYGRHVDLYDEEALAMYRSGDLRKNLATVEMCATADQSRALNKLRGPCLIMAGSGMCTGGRILHHLRHNLHRPDTCVLIVGYQSHGSLGRALVEGAKWVKIYGERIQVRASVHTIGGLSGHAGQTELVQWFDSVAPSKPRVVLTHGEDQARQTLARLLRQRHGVRPELPALNDTIEL